jgi:hypothetical protein
MDSLGLLVARTEVARPIHLFEEEPPKQLVLGFGGEVGQVAA